jgi:magnesium-transporting ATPase (P-type)
LNSLVNREQKLEAVYDTIEHTMELIGSTAIEDKL